MSKFSFPLTKLAYRIAGISTIALLAAAPAQATPVTLSFVGQPYGAEIATITKPVSNSVYAGQMEFSKNEGGVVTSLLTYCVEIFQTTSTSPQFYNLVDGITRFGAERAEDLGRLFSAFDLWNADNVVSTQETAALQLAVWEIVSETNTSNGSLHFDLASGNFLASTQNPGTTALAQDWLNKLPGVSNFYEVSVYENATYQDQLVLNKVPEPGSMALMFGALAAMGFVARRRKNTDAAGTR